MTNQYCFLIYKCKLYQQFGSFINFIKLNLSNQISYNPIKINLNFEQSGGDLEKADDVARIILNMLKICDTSSFITELNSNWINIIFNTYYYSIRNLNKQTVILKKHMHKQYYEQQLAV